MKKKVIILMFLAAAWQSGAGLVFNGSFSENFNSLTSTEGTGNTWTDNSTIPGWYSSQTTYNVNHGNSPAVALYDFGSSGSSDRALGCITGSGATVIYYGVALQNVTGGAITALQIQYHGEEWREASAAADTLTFQYLVGNPSGNNIANGTWTTVSSLNFTGPQYGSGTSLDGNAAANSANVASMLTGLSIASGGDFWLRWMDNDVTGNDAGLAIDDLFITAVPEPSEWGLIAGVFLFGLVALRSWRSRRRSAPDAI